VVDALNSSDWREEEADWERLQRDCKAAFLAQDLPRARKRIGEALALAKQHFQPGDPRLAASLAFQAWLLRKNDPRRAHSLFQEAHAHWRLADAWLSRQPPPERLARSSSFHFRLESKHPGAYLERRLEDMTSLLASGRSLTERLQDGRSLPPHASPAPAGSPSNLAFDTHRKIKTAIDLLPHQGDEVFR